MKTDVKIYLPDIIGKGYSAFWNSRKRYLVCKGSRGSKKSCTTALKIIFNMMKYPKSNTLVIRRYNNTNRDSTFARLIWAINRLNVSHLWKITVSPLNLIYRPTGQKIIFRGIDNPQSITSITVEDGYLCWVWWEEAFQVTNEDDFNKVDMSIRGKIPEEFGLWKQHILTFNPWSDKIWLKERFFDKPDSDTFALTTNYLCNEFLGDDDLAIFRKMEINNPKRYKVEGLGDWGIAEGLVYENWTERAFDLEEVKKIHNIKSAFGLDFGYTNDPSALCCMMVDVQNKIIYVFDEMYGYGMSNEKIYKAINNMSYSKERIVADCASPKDIDHLRDIGLRNIRKSRKGNDSVNHGIQYIQDFKIIIHSKCVNFLTEINNYTWDTDKFGTKTNKPVDKFNHLLDAMRYGMEEFIKGDIFSFD